MQALAVDPAQPGTLYLGTYIAGMFKTTDHGASWSPVGWGPLTTYAIAVDPVAPATVFAADWSSIFRSSDGGVTWSLVASFPNHGVYGIAVDPTTHTNVFAAVYDVGVVKSIDGGDTWTPKTTGLGSLEVRAVGVDPANATTVYVAGEDGVWKSIDGGDSWTAASSGLPNADAYSLAIDPATPTTLYVGTSGGVAKSTDGGATWQNSSTGLGAVQVDAVRISLSNPLVLYAGTAQGVYRSADGGGTWTRGVLSQESRDVVVDPSDAARAYGCGRAGVYVTTDGLSWAEQDAGIHAVPAESVVADPRTAGTLYIAALGEVQKTVDDGTVWTRSFPAAGTLEEIAVSPRGRPVYVTGFGPTGAAYRSLNGKRWRPGKDLAATFVITLLVHPARSTELYAGTFDDGIFKSTNKGGRWHQLPASPVGTNVGDLAADPGVAGTVYAATDGGVAKTIDGGLTWTPSNTGIAGNDLVLGAVAVNPQNPSNIYVGCFTTGHVLRSDDGGATWSDASSGLPTGSFDDGVRALLVDPSNPATVYAGTRGAGAFRTIDGGATWSAINAGMTFGEVRRFTAGPGTPAPIYAGTRQGVFRLTEP